MSEHEEILAWLQGDDLLVALAFHESKWAHFEEPVAKTPYDAAASEAEPQDSEDRGAYLDHDTRSSSSPHRSTPAEPNSLPPSAPNTSNGLAEIRLTTHDRKSRRREQNRRAQQAYRSRKEELRKNLEDQIDEWKAKHDHLHRSYVNQSNEIRKLRSQIKELRAQAELLELQFFDLVPRPASFHK